MNEVPNLIDELRDKATKYHSYQLFKQSLIRDDVIELCSQEVRTAGFKGLKEFFKSVKRNK